MERGRVEACNPTRRFKHYLVHTHDVHINDRYLNNFGRKYARYNASVSIVELSSENLLFMSLNFV